MAFTSLPAGHYKNIPEESFSSGDMMRIIAKNLTKLERLHLTYFYLIILPSSGAITDLIEVIALLFKPTKVIIRILKFFRIWNMILDRINPLDAAMLIMLLPSSIRKDATTLLKVLEREYLLES